MKLSILEPEPREAGAILICDEEMNDIAEFFHSDHATVGQSYETAINLARATVSLAVMPPEMFVAIRSWVECPAGRRPSAQALGKRIEEIAATVSHP